MTQRLLHKFSLLSTGIGIQHDHFNITLSQAKMEFICKYIHYIMTKVRRHLIQRVPAARRYTLYQVPTYLYEVLNNSAGTHQEGYSS